MIKKSQKDEKMMEYCITFTFTSVHCKLGTVRYCMIIYCICKHQKRSDLA